MKSFKSINLGKAIDNAITIGKKKDGIHFYENMTNKNNHEIDRLNYLNAEVDALYHASDSLREKLTTAIKGVEGKSSARCISADDIIDTLTEYTLKLGISKKAMEGIRVLVNAHAQKFPSAYKYAPMATFFSAEYKNGTWRVSDIYRDTCGTHKLVAIMPTVAKDAIICKYSTI